MGLDLIPGQRWYTAHRADARACALYLRHYSAEKNRRYRNPRSLNFVAAGQPMVLLTTGANACFVWLRNTAERLDHQDGICCTLFRNEGAILSSDLVKEADQLAWARWPERRHFTYVDPGKTASRRGKRNPPGFCFIAAGWRPVLDDGGEPVKSTTGLHLLEMFPEWAR